MAFVYILQSQKSGNFYIGSTNNLPRRLRGHLLGHGRTIRRFLPYKLIFTQEYTTVKEAQWVEKRLKKLKRKDYIQKIVKDGHIRIKLRRPEL